MVRIVWIVKCDRTPDVTLFLDELMEVEKKITAMFDSLPALDQEVSVFDEVSIESVGQRCLRLDINRVMSCGKSGETK